MPAGAQRERRWYCVVRKAERCERRARREAQAAQGEHSAYIKARLTLAAKPTRALARLAGRGSAINPRDTLHNTVRERRRRHVVRYRCRCQCRHRHWHGDQHLLRLHRRGCRCGSHQRDWNTRHAHRRGYWDRLRHHWRERLRHRDDRLRDAVGNRLHRCDTSIACVFLRWKVAHSRARADQPCFDSSVG